MKTVLRERYAYAGGASFPPNHLHDGTFEPLCGTSLTDPGTRMWDEVEVEDGAPICPDCLHARNGYKVRLVSGPEPRSTQDRNYIYEITDLKEPCRPWLAVRAYCRLHVRLSLMPAEVTSWADPVQVVLEETSPGTWKYHVREAYTG